MTLFNTIGGKQTIEQVVDNFHKRILADNTLKGFFAKTDMDKQRRHQVAFFSQIFDGPKEYNGRPMEKTHTGMKLQQQHFDAIVKHLTDAMTECGVSAENTKAALASVSNFKGAILNK